MSTELQPTIELAQRYGISAEEADRYLALADDREFAEAACAARGRGVAHQVVVQALQEHRPIADLRKLRKLDEGA